MSFFFLILYSSFIVCGPSACTGFSWNLCFSLQFSPVGTFLDSSVTMLHIATLFYSIALFAGLATLPVALADTWGPAYSLGPTSTSIIEAYTVFNPGTPPSPTQEYVFTSQRFFSLRGRH